MSTEANGSSLLLPPPPQPIADHVSAPVPSPSPAPPVASTVHSPSAEAAAAAVAAIHADALAAQAHAHAKAQAEAAIEAQAHIQNSIHQQQQNHHESASASPNPLKRSLELNQEEDSTRLKVARLENEHFDVSHSNSPTATPAEVNGTHSADPPTDVQAHQQEQQQPQQTHQHTAESHFQAQPQPQSVENQQPIHPHVPSHTSTPVPTNDSTAHEIPHGPNQHQQAQQQQLPQSQAQHEHARNLTPDEQQEVMRLIDTDVAARAIEASAANAVAAAAVTSAAPTASMDTQATQINVPATPNQAAETANAISQSQAQQAMASVPVNANSASLDVNVDNVHAAVAIHEAGKPQANMSYPGPQLQPGPGPLSLPHTPSRPMNFPLASPQVGTEKPYGCAHCEMSFRRLHDLKRHSKLHTGEKPHVCPKCERKFARGDALARHSKGVGGCAARRTSMNTFVDTNDLDNHGLLTGEAPAMGSIVYGQPDDRSAIAPPDARFHPTPESQFSDTRISSLQLQPSRDSTAAAATTATTTPVYSTVGISTNAKDLDEANAGVQSTAEVQRTSDLGLARPAEDAGAEDKTRAGTAGSAVSLASPAPNSTAAAAPAPTLASPAATTTAAATTTTTTTADPSLNMFTSGNAAIWTYIISLEARLATLEKTDREKSDQIAAMEKHISLIAAQLSAPKE
ncbi:DNA-binding protein creA [Ceratocystis platani]|uniref:DNA-binding protein creA n=1 Tax=Ceratocystis fimbriata f. sp. platani TaxID=88771 RepID=A0A0F8CWM3_CERFI|nr:DNA-binding protein creA [Ceratocystis platani]